MRNYENVLYIVIILLLGLLISFRSFININLLPSGIDTPAHIFKIKLIEESVKKYNKLPSWDPYWYGGYPVFALYPILPYLIPTFFNILINNVTLTYNILRYLSLVLLSIVSFLLTNEVSRNKKISFLSAMLVLSSYPIFNNTYTIGRFPTSLGLLFYLLGIYFLLKREIYEKLLFKYILLFAIILTLLLQIHPMLFYLYFISSIPILTINLFRYKKTFRIFVINSLVLVVVIVGLNFQFLYSFLKNFLILQPFWITYYTINPKLFYLGIYGDTFPLYMGIFHITLFALGFLYSILKRNFMIFLFGILALLFFTLTFGKYSPVYQFLPFKEQFDLARFQMLSSLWMAIVGAFGLRPLLELFEKTKIIYWMISFVVFILFLDIFPAVSETYNWKPNINCGGFNLNSSYRGLAIGFRHWDSYLLPTCFDLENIMGWFQQSDPHFNFTQILQATGGLWYAHDENFKRVDSITLFKNLLRLSNTKYVIYGKKSWYPENLRESIVGSYYQHIDEGENLRLRNKILNDEDFVLVFNSSAIEIFELKTSFSYCEPVEPIWISNNYQGRAVDFLSTNGVFPQIPVLGKSVELQSNLDALITCTREDPETIHIITNKPAWILVKESYYPFWKTKSETKIYNGFGFMVLYVNDAETLYYRV